MKISEEQKATIDSWVQKWAPRLLLQNHKINCIWRTRVCKGDTRDSIVYAQTHGAFSGLDADIEIFPAFSRLPSQETQERIILHELVHVVCSGASEQETTVLTQILWNAYNVQP